MSSSIVFDPGFGDSRQAPRWWHDTDGAFATVARDDEAIKVTWDLTDYLASGETVSSAAYVDEGTVTSSRSVSSPQILFTMTGNGETEVTATLSTGRIRQAVFRICEPAGSPTRDYGR